MFYVSRFKNIEKREYDCEVVTPLFLGGADPKEAELRVPPVKAAMRFWWRALYEGGNVEQMAKEEADIFGSTEKKAMITVKIENIISKSSLEMPAGKMVPVEGKSYKTSIINYLSYGLFEYKNEIKKNVYIRKHIEPSGHFKLIVSFPKNMEPDVVQATKAMITFGGLGSRSRNGFGSLYCAALIDRTVKKEGELKSFTSFSKETNLFDKFNTYMNWEDALSEIGDVYRNARLKLERKHSWNNRKFIAMPIEAQRENIPDAIRRGRHAKPYFLHISKTIDGKYRGQILFLPYQYKSRPDDHSNQQEEYMTICKKMNEEIAREMGGTR